VERASSAWWRDESWERRSSWRESTSWRSWESRRRMAAWSFSAVEAGEPEERAAEEKEVVEKEAERKAERMGSEARDSRADVAVVVGLLRVERSWRGEEDFWSGDAGDAILRVVFGFRNAFGFFYRDTGEGRFEGEILTLEHQQSGTGWLVSSTVIIICIYASITIIIVCIRGKENNSCTTVVQDLRDMGGSHMVGLIRYL
jgi:hypothetical protein